MKKIAVFTDGACSGNPGPGGWGVLLRYNGHEKTLYGGELDTTNNRMELTAAIKALAALKTPCIVDLTTDSQYLRKGITEWIKKWQKNGWRNSNKQPVKNLDLWQLLLSETTKHQINWHWVEGHSGHAENEKADELARRGIQESLQRG